MGFKYIIIFIILLSFRQESPLDQKTFTLKALGFKIGHLQAYHLKKEVLDCYVTNSTVDFLTLKAKVKTESIFENNLLIKSVVTSTINGAVYNSKTIWKKDHYDIDCNARKYSHKDTTIQRRIKWTAGKLYFERAEIGEEIFAESYGTLGKLAGTQKNILKMTTPESKQIYYYDKDNLKLLKIEVVNSIKNFEMIPDK